MGPQHEQTCFLICEDCQEITELEETGLRIFRYKLNLGRVEESQTTQDLQVNIGETKEIFIVMNTKDILLPTTIDVPKHVLNKIPCKRCRHIAEHAQKHLKKKVGINEITGICDHCRAKRNSQDVRALCDDIIKKYFFGMCRRDTAKDFKPQLTRMSRSYSDTELRTVIRRRLRPRLEIEAEEPKRAMHRCYSQESFITSFPRLSDIDTNYPLNKCVFLKYTKEKPLRADVTSAELISGIRERQRLQAEELERKPALLIESSVENMIDTTRVRKVLEEDHTPIEKKMKLIGKQEMKPEKKELEKMREEKISHRREPEVKQPQKVEKLDIKPSQVDQTRQVGKSILEKEPKKPPEKEDILKDTKHGRETKEKVIKSEKPKSVNMEDKESKVKEKEKPAIEMKQPKPLTPPPPPVPKLGKIEAKDKASDKLVGKVTPTKEKMALPLPPPTPSRAPKLEKLAAKDKESDKLVRKEKPTKEKKQPSPPTLPEPPRPKLDKVKAEDKETKIKPGKALTQPQLPPASKPDKMKVTIIEEKANTEKGKKLLMKGKKEDEKLPEKPETKSNNIPKPNEIQELMKKMKEKKDIELEKPLTRKDLYIKTIYDTKTKQNSRKGELSEDTEKKKVKKKLQIASSTKEDLPSPSLLQQHFKGYAAQLAKKGAATEAEKEKQKQLMERELKMNEIIMAMDINNFQYSVSNPNAPTSTLPELPPIPGKYTLMKILTNATDDSMSYDAKAKRVEGDFLSEHDQNILKDVLTRRSCKAGLKRIAPMIVDSDKELMIENFLHKPQKLKKEMIKDVKIVHLNPSESEEKISETKPAMLFQKTITKFPSDDQIKKFSSDQNISEQISVIDLTDPKRQMVRYTLSDRSFIDKGWTVLPTQKVLRKMHIYRMRPARPELDWFQRNKSKGYMSYDSGEKLAEFEDDGRARCYYKNGRLALNYYEAEEANAKQRFIIHSSGEQDSRGRSRPITVLAMFDYSGNGIVFDHSGKIRLKYNQTEGVVLDRSLGPVTHWKWHSLNDPPVLQQVMIDTNMASKDPRIEKINTEPNHKERPVPDPIMLNIEFDNFVKEKTKKISSSFSPYQIKMKALEINEQFSLRILNQATIYLHFHDGSTHIKLNLGMLLDHHEIIDTKTVELGDVWNSFEASPAPSASIENLQKNLKSVQHAERLRRERENRLRPPVPRTAESADQLAATLSRQVRPAVEYFSG